MRWIYGLIVSFSTYSKIPMPHVEWNDAHLRYSLCFFPLVGALIGALVALWLWAAEALALGGALKGAVGALIPLLLSGGIHMDGFMDTVDALSSHQPKERKLEILKDPHAGAFAVMACAMYLLLMAGLMGEAKDWIVGVALSAGYVLSRALSALALVSLRSAKPTGMLSTFKSTSDVRAVRLAACGYVLICGGAMLAVNLALGLAVLATSTLCFAHYRHIAYRQFGGVTGDLAGYFVQVCELAVALVAVIIGRFV